MDLPDGQLGRALVLLGPKIQGIEFRRRSIWRQGRAKIANRNLAVLHATHRYVISGRGHVGANLAAGSAETVYKAGPWPIQQHHLTFIFKYHHLPKFTNQLTTN